MLVPQDQLLRAVLLNQEIGRLQSKIGHFQGRVDRGSADDEDRISLKFYSDLLIDIATLPGTMNSSRSLASDDVSANAKPIKPMLAHCKLCGVGPEEHAGATTHKYTEAVADLDGKPLAKEMP